MLKTIKKLTLIAVLATAFGTGVSAQPSAGIKTNLFYDVTGTVNLGLEVGLAPKWTLDVSGNINAWKVSDQIYKHWRLQPEARYWFCDRFAGHFLGVHALGGQFNVGHWRNPVDFLGTRYSMLKDYRAQGWGVGAGIAYGYAWILGKHWNLELELGIGWVHTWYDVYECKECGRKVKSDQQDNYYGPTKAAVNLVYVF